MFRFGNKRPTGDKLTGWNLRSHATWAASVLLVVPNRVGLPRGPWPHSSGGHP